MVESSEVKYLGDILHENGKSKATFPQRISRGYSIAGQILGLLKELPLGNLKTEVGLAFRQAWLINGILYNSEVWHGLRECDGNNFAAIDKHLLRGLVDSHSTTLVEHLYLEMAALPIPHVMRARRLLYLQTILKRHDSELTKRVYMCQKANPLPGDWCLKVKEDLSLLE